MIGFIFVVLFIIFLFGIFTINEYIVNNKHKGIIEKRQKVSELKKARAKVNKYCRKNNYPEIFSKDEIF